MTLLTGAGALLAPTGLLRATGVSASLVADRLPVAERDAAMALARTSSAYRAISNEFAIVDASLGALRPNLFPKIPAAVLATQENRDFRPAGTMPQCAQHGRQGSASSAKSGARVSSLSHEPDTICNWSEPRWSRVPSCASLA